MWRFLHALGSPKRFFDWSGRWLPYCLLIAVFGLGYGLYAGLFVAPADFQQGDGFRLIYWHVPAAFFSLGLYVAMAVFALGLWIWNIKVCASLMFASAEVGMGLTALALLTGSLWGKPMWGTWWVWDARLTSELILFFLYLGVQVLRDAIPSEEKANKACALLACIGCIDLPIIHFSVQWWQTLHQGASLSLFTKPTIAGPMLYPLFGMLIGLGAFCLYVVLSFARSDTLWRHRSQRWVQEEGRSC